MRPLLTATAVVLAALLASAPAGVPANPAASQYAVWSIYDARGALLAQGGQGAPSDRLRLRLFGPGSTLKPFLLAAAIAGGFDEKEVFDCLPYPLREPPERRCWLAAGHGAVGLSRAVADSCSAYVRRACRNVDPDRYRALLLAHGFREGLPDAAPFRQLDCEAWMGLKPGILVNAGELARAYLAAFAGADSLEGKPGAPLVGLAALRQGLRECCVSGTAHALRQTAPDLSIMGKTGTGQSADGARVGVFVGLAPAKAPERAIVAVLAGARGSDAARLAGEVLAQAKK